MDSRLSCTSTALLFGFAYITPPFNVRTTKGSDSVSIKRNQTNLSENTDLPNQGFSKSLYNVCVVHMILL